MLQDIFVECKEREKDLRRKGFKYAFLSMITTLMLIVCAGCALLDPSASLKGMNKEAYDCIVNSSFSAMEEVKVLSGKMYGGDLYCHAYYKFKDGRTNYELCRVTSYGDVKIIPITIYTLNESDRCLAEGYLDLDALNTALKSYYKGNYSAYKFGDLNMGGNMSATSYIIAIVVILILDLILALAANSTAQDKGYDGSKYFHLCFWLGPIGFIVVAGLPDIRTRVKLDETNQLLGEVLKKMEKNAQYVGAGAETNRLLNEMLNKMDEKEKGVEIEADK